MRSLTALTSLLLLASTMTDAFVVSPSLRHQRMHLTKQSLHPSRAALVSSARRSRLLKAFIGDDGGSHNVKGKEVTGSVSGAVDEKPLIKVIENIDDFLSFLGQDDQICVIKFHANWCKSCQKFGVKYQKLANDMSARGESVRFASIEFSKNAPLCRSLGIKRLPNVHIYKGSLGQLSAFPCGPNKFGQLEDKLERYLPMSDEALELERNLQEGTSLADQIVTELQQEHWDAATKTSASGSSSTTTTENSRAQEASNENN